MTTEQCEKHKDDLVPNSRCEVCRRTRIVRLTQEQWDGIRKELEKRDSA